MVSSNKMIDHEKGAKNNRCIKDEALKIRGFVRALEQPDGKVDDDAPNQTDYENTKRLY